MRLYLFGAAAALGLMAACAKPEVEPIQLDGIRLTVDNRTDQDWTDVEMWINRYFRLKVPKIRKGQRFQAQLDSFVSGYGRRFEFERIQIKDLRVNAKAADGTLIELRKEMTGDPLTEALKGIGGKK
jgi:hypothetical protein